MTASAQGVDLSEYQEVYTVEQIKALDFIFIKATEGEDITDPHFAANWANAKAAGKPRGAYHFLHPGEDIAKQVAHFLAVVKAAGLEDGDMLVVDSEYLSGAAAPRATRMVKPASEADQAVTAEGVDAATKGFLDGVKAGVNDTHPLVVYTMHEVGQYLIATAESFPILWFAFPSDVPPDPSLIAPWHHWRFWQWSWSGNLDKDAFDGTAENLEAWLKLYRPKPKVPQVKVPDVRGLRGAVARRRLNRAGLRDEPSAKVPRFHTSRVLDQSPKPGELADKGSAVKVTLKVLR